MSLLILALIPAVWGQSQLIQYRSAGWVGSLLGLVMVVFAVRIAGPPASPWSAPPRDPRLARRWWMVGPALLFGLLAWWFQLGDPPREPLVLRLWGLALGCLLVPYLIPGRGEWRFDRSAFVATVGRHWREWAAVALLLGVALAFRLPYLERYPVAVHNDEASCALMGQQILERHAAGELYWFTTCDGFWHFPAIGFFPSAVGQTLTRTHLYGHRLANVVLGMVALLCLYALARSLLGVPAALITLGLAATAHVAVHWSRSGIHSGHATWLTVICAWLVWKAVSTGRTQWFVLAGFSLPACLLTYSAAYLVPVWLCLVLGVCWIASPEFRRRFTAPLGVLALSSLVFFAPMAAWYQKYPETFFNRAAMMVWTDEPAVVEHMRSQFEGDFRLGMVARNWQRTTHLLHTSGDANLQYGNRGIGVVDRFTAVILVLGLGVAVASLCHPGHWPLLAALALNILLGAVLALDGVQYSRIAGMALIVAAVPALWGQQLYRNGRIALGRWGGRLIAAALAVGVVWIGLENRRYTFDLHDDLSWTSGVPRVMSVRATLARNVRDWGDANFTFVHTDLPAEFWEHAYRLISGDRSMAPFDTAEQIDLSLADGFDTVTFVVPQENRWLLSQLEASFPGGRPVAIEVEFHDPEDVALAYRIDATSR